MESETDCEYLDAVRYGLTCLGCGAALSFLSPTWGPEDQEVVRCPNGCDLEDAYD